MQQTIFFSFQFSWAQELNSIQKTHYFINSKFYYILQQLQFMSSNLIQFDQNSKIGTRIGNYSIIQLLGKGGFGDVYKATHNQTKTIVALKIIDKAKIQKQSSPRIKQIKKRLVKSEAQIMMKCNSDYVVKCYERFENSESIVFVLEYCNQKDLAYQLKKRRKIPEFEAITILKHIILGFAELHKHKVVHRDLKSENIFKHNEKYKIGDLGFAKIIPNLMEIQGTTLGTLTTMAPQVMGQQKYGIKADIWSLGMIYYEMLYGELPIKFRSRADSLKQFGKPLNYPENENCSPQSKQLLKRLLVADPKQRINWNELYDHEIFKQDDKQVMTDNFRQNVKLNNGQQYLKIQKQEFDMQKELDDAQKLQDQKLKEEGFKKIDKIAFNEEKKYLEVSKQIQASILNYISELSFQKEKSKLLYNNIVKVLIKDFPFIKNKKFYYEFLFLIICRCFFVVSPINNVLVHQYNAFKWKYYKEFLNCSISQSFLKQFKEHYNLISEKKKYIEDQLYLQENKLKNMFSDFMEKIFHHQQYKERQKFCSGIQEKDYNMTEQIDFTLKNYVPILLNEIQSRSLTQDETKKLDKLKKFLEDQYKYINVASFQNQKAYIKLMSEKYYDQN